MGELVDGVWHTQRPLARPADGAFRRSASSFRHWVTPDGRPGPSGDGGFRAQAGRYRLYVSYACPWAHRTLIMRSVKELESLVELSVVHWLMGEGGWSFDDGPGVVPDPDGAHYLYEIYLRADPRFSGRVTVPVLWDRERRTIVSNESAEIVRMFDTAFDALGAAPGHYYPDDLADEIDTINARVYDGLNDGVYRAGFAATQDAYERAATKVFETLDWLEERLAEGRYLCGDRLTEADWRLLPTLLRFDPVYHGHFKCNLRQLVDYPRLWAYAQALYRQPGIAETCRFDHMKRHYYLSHPHINPAGIVPLGPRLDFAGG